MRLAEAVWLTGTVESVSWMDTVEDPAADGVPLIKPVEGFSVSPAGRPVADHVYGARPPVAPRVKLYGTPITPERKVVLVMPRTPTTDSDKFAVATSGVGAVESVNVITTVLVVAADAVPLMTPVP